MTVASSTSFYANNGPTPADAVELESAVRAFETTVTTVNNAAIAAAASATSAQSAAEAATAAGAQSVADTSQAATVAVERVSQASTTAIANLNATLPAVTAAAVQAAEEAAGSFTAATSATARPLQSRVRDLGASLLDFVPAPADLATYDTGIALRAAFTAGVRVVSVPARAARYQIKSKVTVPLGCSLLGDGGRLSVFNVGSEFRLMGVGGDPTEGVIVLAAGEPGGTLKGLGFEFSQPATATTRAALYQYVPAVYAKNSARCRLSDIYVSGAWDGFDLSGNTGGFFATQIECGAANRGLYIDGAYDFPHVSQFHFWIFGFTSTNLQAAFADSQPVAAYVGRADGINMVDLSIYHGRIVLADPSQNATPGEAPRQLANVSLDGDGSRITILGGSNNLTGHYSTKTSPTLSSVEVSGGITTITPTILRSAEGVPFFAVSGGRLQVLGGQVWQNTHTGRIARVTGGRAEFSGLAITRNSGTGTVPSFEQSGTGVMVVERCSWLEPSGGTTKGYPAVVYGTDVAGNRCSGNTFNGYTLVPPATFTAGSYGPNKGAQFTWTPTLSFQNGNGTFAPNYTVQEGRYSFDFDRLVFWGRLVFTVPAYSGASGGFQITGLPGTMAGAIQTAVSGSFSGFAYPSGVLDYAANTKNGGLQLRKMTAAGGQAEVSSQDVTAAGQTYEFFFNGHIMLP